MFLVWLSLRYTQDTEFVVSRILYANPLWFHPQDEVISKLLHFLDNKCYISIYGESEHNDERNTGNSFLRELHIYLLLLILI